MTKKIRIESDVLMQLFGVLDNNLQLIENHYKVKLAIAKDSIVINGAEHNAICAELLCNKLIGIIESGQALDTMKILNCMDMIDDGEIESSYNDTVVAVTAKGRQIKCKTKGQRIYVDRIRSNSVVFGIGPAGTGKTYLAVALGAVALKSHEVERIILTRPAIEAGEKLGFLPGDLQQKVDPYLRPLYDALNDMFGADYARLIERQVVEIAPLAYMRGRTLSNAFIILDEAQNTTPEQMKMFLTRLGEGSKAVINGDLTQIDLPYGKTSGLRQAVEILKDIDNISVVGFTKKDVVRHELVRAIVEAYDNAKNKTAQIKQTEE